MGTHKENAEIENRVNRGYLVLLKERKIGQKYKLRYIEDRGNQGMPVYKFSGKLAIF